MTRLVTFAALVAVVPIAAQTSAPQSQHASMAMGFDQEKAAHHFFLYDDGGAIEVSVKDQTDNANLDAIRKHLPHIVQMFAAGNFDTPMMVHQKKVPGTDVMAAARGKITYRYGQTPSGGRVDITTKDAGALAAVHEFLKFQITDHKTGDSLDVRKR